ncbi:Membrane-bound lytic murein transglycosylase F [Vibrio hippocampi]|uniref:diguanylate cyclase n=2 Tax=Vibrio hippocampi TaxID=654686 RepID=A0ABN8DLW2_9VIBR|nr:Membrane-bound lytic murein transglycosylase F [Vibrio hippocampi]
MMHDGQLDVMLNIVDLPERRQHLSFTTPYAKSLSGIFTTNENSKKIFNFNDLKGKTVAVPAGFDLEINLPKYHPEIKIIAVKDILECIEAIHSGRADAFMEEIGVVDYIISQRMVSDLRLAFQVSDEPFISNLNIATGVDNVLLFSIIQKGLNAITADELNRIRKKWLLKVHELYDQSMVNLNVTEKEYLFANPEVKICVDPSWPPLDFIDDNGVHSGLSADLINKIAKRIGVRLRLVPTATWEETLDSLKAGKCDIIPLMNETKEAKRHIDFTQAYFQFPTVIATHDDASFIGDYTELYGKKVALQAYYFITDYVREHHPQIEIIEVENTREALKLVSGQKVFATIDGLPNVVNSVEALALENIKIVGSVPQENSMKLGVGKGKQPLVSIFQKGISSLSEQEKVGLYKKWFDIEVSRSLFDSIWLVRIAILVAIVMVFLLWRQFTLSKYAKAMNQLNAKLRHIATTDHLTAIANRRCIEKQLLLELKKKRTIHEPLSVLLLDIDYFKTINDTYGHLTGDKILQELATLLTGAIRSSDYIGRWGGEEFLFVLPKTEHSQAEIVAKDLKDKIEQHDFGLNTPVTASLGVAQVRSEESTVALLGRADRGLYQAKKLGRNSVVNMELECSFLSTRASELS